MKRGIDYVIKRKQDVLDNMFKVSSLDHGMKLMTSFSYIDQFQQSQKDPPTESHKTDNKSQTKESETDKPMSESDKRFFDFFNYYYGSELFVKNFHQPK
jgi:hypothetical protein